MVGSAPRLLFLQQQLRLIWAEEVVGEPRIVLILAMVLMVVEMEDVEVDVQMALQIQEEMVVVAGRHLLEDGVLKPILNPIKNIFKFLINPKTI